MITKQVFSLLFGALLLAQVADAAPKRYYNSSKRSVSPIVSISPAYYSGSELVQTGGSRKKQTAPRAARKATRSGGSGDYLYQVGGNARWPEGKIIRVYVAPGKATYKYIVATAMTQWSRASGGRINYALTNDPNSADYTFSWSSAQKEISAGTEAGLTTTDTIDQGSGEFIEHARTRVLTRYNGRQLSDAAIAETVLHEIGHGLGMEGHSSNPRDIMFYAAVQGQGGLTARDANTISRLYAQ